MNPKEKAIQLIKDFGINAYLVTEEIVMGLYDEGIKEPQYWYDVQKEIDLFNEIN